MAEIVRIRAESPSGAAATCRVPAGQLDSGKSPSQVVWLQCATLAWMLVECGVSLYGAASAHSPALLAFGADSLVELLSATVVLLAEFRFSSLTRNRAAWLNGILLFALAGAIALVALLALAFGIHPETSLSGIAITIAALLVMPLLAWAISII